MYGKYKVYRRDNADNVLTAEAWSWFTVVVVYDLYENKELQYLKNQSRRQLQRCHYDVNC